jgi:hypothetical protein
VAAGAAFGATFAADFALVEEWRIGEAPLFTCALAEEQIMATASAATNK